jgi:CDP-diacylglycerol--glycerol-3-phosphate 3-phosphatidyltransferase
MISSVYGPTAIRTPANLITLLRILATPLVVVFVLNDKGSYWPAAMWFVLALTDGFDGFVARKQGATRSGAFLDPLADKLMVFSTFGVLVYLGRISIWLVLIMGVRELAVSLYRTFALKKGVSVPAGMLGKLKMVSQLFVIELALLPDYRSFALFISPLMLLATALAIVSAYQYFRNASLAT